MDRAIADLGAHNEHRVADTRYCENLTEDADLSIPLSNQSLLQVCVSELYLRQPRANSRLERLCRPYAAV